MRAETAVRSIAVVGTRSAAHSLAVATLLKDSIDRHGWAGRLRVEVAGLGGGAGAASAVELRMLRQDGREPIGASCIDVGENQDLLAGADCLVVASADDAQLFLEWPQADGKQVYALTDFLDADAWAIEDPEAGFRDYVDEVERAVPALVGTLIAWPRP